MISSGSQRGLEQAREESVGRNLALVGDDVAPSAEHGGRIVRGRIVVGDRAADRAAIAHLRIADAAGERRRAREIAALTSAEAATSAWRVIAPMVTTLPRRPRCRPVCGIADRSTSAAGAASRSFMVGSSVMPPASGVLVGDAASRADRLG